MRVYIDAAMLVGTKKGTVAHVFEVLAKYKGDDELFLVSSDGQFRKKIGTFSFQKSERILAKYLPRGSVSAA